MPATYNGIGTHYYGKKNLRKRSGACRQCGSEVELKSYDTRLWFVFFFIPLIPLGRKRIIDQCPACTRHYAIDLSKWETARQLEVSGALEQFRSNPTPEGAIAAHQQLLHFHQLEQAADFQKTMLEKYPDNAKVRAYLGAAAEHIGRHEDALKQYQRALELRTDLPEARMGVARGHLRAGRLDETRKLLDFLEKPGAAQLYSLELLESLALAFQRAGRHSEALELFGRIQAELPAVVEHKGFRNSVRKSEKELGRKETSLPKRKFSLRRLFQPNTPGTPQLTWRSLMVVGIVMALVVLAFVISNEFIRRNRTLHIVNVLGEPATIVIDGVGGVENFRGMRTLKLAEGRYRAVITGPVREEIDFEVRAGYFSRWLDDPLWVINVGGAGVLLLQHAVYSENPAPPTYTFHFGKSFEQFSGVTHPFTGLPDSVNIKSGETRTLVQLDVFKGSGSDVFAYYSEGRNPARALNFAEAWLRIHPQDSDVLRRYASAAIRQGQTNRLDAWIRPGLSARPVRTDWHRLYQTLHDRPAEHSALVAQYDELLRTEPANSALLYLRGRLENNRTAARRYHERAMEADSKNPFPAFALAFDRVTVGDWKSARPLLARATGLKPDEPGFENWLMIARLALGEAERIEQEMKSQLQRNPVDYLAEIRLLDALATQNRSDAALKALAEFGGACTQKYGPAAKSLITSIRYHALYALGDFAALQTAAANDPAPPGRYMLAIALMEQGKINETNAAWLPDMGANDRGLWALACSLAWNQAGNRAAADEWHSRAVREFQQGSTDDALAAALLAGENPSLAQIEEIVIDPRVKAALAAMLAQRHPQSRAQFNAFARKLNVERVFPFHLVQRVTAGAP